VATCAAYVAISFVKGILWNAVSLGFAVLIGLIRGIYNSLDEASAIDEWKNAPSVSSSVRTNTKVIARFRTRLGLQA
jgi:hypothetical protein